MVKLNIESLGNVEGGDIEIVEMEQLQHSISITYCIVSQSNDDKDSVANCSQQNYK